MVILGLVVVLLAVDAVINGYVCAAFSPEQVHEANTVLKAMRVAAVLELGEFIFSGEFLREKRVVADEVAAFFRDQRLDMLPQVSRCILCMSEPPRDVVMR